MSSITFHYNQYLYAIFTMWLMVTTCIVAHHQYVSSPQQENIKIPIFFSQEKNIFRFFINISVDNVDKSVNNYCNKT